MPLVLFADLASVKLDSLSHCLSLSLCLLSILPAHFLVKYIYKLRAMHLHVLVHIFFSPFSTGNFSMEFHNTHEDTIQYYQLHANFQETDICTQL